MYAKQIAVEEEEEEPEDMLLGRFVNFFRFLNAWVGLIRFYILHAGQRTPTNNLSTCTFKHNLTCMGKFKITLQTSLINTKLGDFVNLGVLFLT